jgi:UDPglucose 6-dehydrogenase
MKVSVAGLWHLGTVSAACLASADHEVVGYDRNAEVISELNQQRAPLFEPGLDKLLAQGFASKKLKFSQQQESITDSKIILIAYDTPVDADDRANVDFVMEEIIRLFPYIPDNALLLISSQLPVGSTTELCNLYKQQHPNKNVSFAYTPENLRLGNAIAVFTKPDRIVIGIQQESDKNLLIQLFKPFTENIIWMSVESAEMTKHAINAFLATSVAFANELANLCEYVGANASEVERGLKSEARIGPKAYLKAGNAFAGGTLARDVFYLTKIGQKHTQPTQLFSAVINSNITHKQWSQKKLQAILGDLKNKTIAVLGLTYKPHTNTLRRSAAIETCSWLKQQGAIINAFDPAITALPGELAEFINIKSSIQDALNNTHAALISTECPDFLSLTARDFVTCMKQPIIVDIGGFLCKQLDEDPSINYFCVGRKK